MGKFLRLGGVFVYLVGSSLAAAESDYELVQPSASQHGIVLRTARGQARIEGPAGHSSRLSLHPDELLTTVAETRGGWTVAGTRDVDLGRQVVLLRRDFAGTTRFAAPVPQRYPLRLRPILMVRQEDFEGLAWLEGVDLTSLSVRTANRSGNDWGEISIIAPPARGSQTGLTGTVLEDSTWLIVWSAFDGEDDEILWSRGSADRWQKAQRLGHNNRVPDITPAVVAVDGGALLAWSRVVKGHYQVMMSRFDGTDWTPPQDLGPPGSLEPGFVARDSTMLLVYRLAWPRAWAVADLRSSGRIERWSTVAEESGTRPVVRDFSDSSLELIWPGRPARTARWEMVP